MNRVRLLNPCVALVLLSAAWLVTACGGGLMPSSPAVATEPEASEPTGTVDLPTPTVLSPTLTAIESTPWREAPSGTARIRLLAQGANAFVGWIEIDPGAGVPLIDDDATKAWLATATAPLRA